MIERVGRVGKEKGKAKKKQIDRWGEKEEEGQIEKKIGKQSKGKRDR